MNYSLPYLGKIVNVSIDRPLGTKHPRHDFVYPINYGYVPNTLAPDGSELDAYVLGIDRPVKEFTGRCIGILHRTDDDDDKLIVCEDGDEYSDDEIRQATHFQEQWFKSEIIRPETQVL